MIVKHFGCTTIDNKALYKCIIYSFIQQHILFSSSMDLKRFALLIISSVFCNYYLRAAASDATQNCSKALLVFPVKKRPSFYKKKSLCKSYAILSTNIGFRRESYRANQVYTLTTHQLQVERRRES